MNVTKKKNGYMINSGICLKRKQEKPCSEEKAFEDKLAEMI